MITSKKSRRHGQRGHDKEPRCAAGLASVYRVWIGKITLVLLSRDGWKRAAKFPIYHNIDKKGHLNISFVFCKEQIMSLSVIIPTESLHS